MSVFNDDQVEALNSWTRTDPALRAVFPYAPSNGLGFGDLLDTLGTGGGAVDSVFGRTGAVVAAASDYDANQIDYDNSSSGLTATDVQAALDEIDSTVDALPSAWTDLSDTPGSIVATQFVRGNGVGTALEFFNLFGTINTWSVQQVFDGGLKLNDNDEIVLGTGDDATINFDGIDLQIDPSGDLVVDGDIVPASDASLDLGLDGTAFRTLFLDNNASTILESPTAIGTGGTTEYIIDMGGGAGAIASSEGGRYTFRFDDIASPNISGAGNILTFDLGANGDITTTPLLRFISGSNAFIVSYPSSGGTFSASFSSGASLGTSSGNMQFIAAGNLNFLASAAGRILFNTLGFATNIDFKSNTGGGGASGWLFGDSGVFNGQGAWSFGRGSGSGTLPEDSFVKIEPQLTATASTDFAAFLVEPRAITIPTGTTTHAGSADFVEPDFIATGTLTNAYTVRIVDAPTEGDTNNYALWVDSGKTQLDGELEIDGDLNHDGSNIGFFGTAPAAQAASYTPTNVTTDRSYDADSTSVAELADVLGTLIADLQSYGLLQ